MALASVQAPPVMPFGLSETPPVNRFGLADGAPLPAAVTVAPERAGPMLGAKAVALVAIAIGIGAVGMGLSWALSRKADIEAEAYIRYSIVITLAVYALVGGLIVTRLVPGVRLRWRDGSPATAILFGAGIGGVLSGVLLAVVSGAAGHLSPDPRIVTMMSEGDLAHIVVTIAISCLCAPLVEEVLFRGLLLESLRERGRQAALVGSGAAFSVWHLTPSALRYYALMGLLLGWLYMKRGLLCSMAAHVAFNGVLTVAALAVVLSPAKTLAFGHYSLTEPGGWSRSTQSEIATLPVDAVQLEGPSGAALLVAASQVRSSPSADAIASRLRDGLMAVDIPDLSLDAGTVRTVQLHVGPAVEVDIHYHGAGTMVFVPANGEVLFLVFASGGSLKAQHDFDAMLTSLRPS